ncbi:MAG: hypothetical protein FWE84_01475 [Firmicutes bacterium]|nr:hypothetical protein [Bacillota bacterium]
MARKSAQKGIIAKSEHLLSIIRQARIAVPIRGAWQTHKPAPPIFFFVQPA